MGGISLLDFVFKVRTTVRSLPQWHGARWSAWLRYACARGGLCLEDVAIGILPRSSGRAHFKTGEVTGIRLACPGRAWQSLPHLADSLAKTAGHGEFSAETLMPLAMIDVVGNAIFWQAGKDVPLVEPAPLDLEFLQPQVERLTTLNRWTLEITGPLRLPLPPRCPQKGNGRERYCGPEFFESPGALCHLLSRVRHAQDLAGSVEDFTPRLVHADLYWDDMRYSASRKVALGGVCGKMIFEGSPDEAAATLLVAGQYLGAGKNARFGLGYWHIAEPG